MLNPRVLPRISCLMVTKGRPAWAQRTIDSYIAQDYPHRNMVIVSDGTEEVEQLTNYAQQCGREDIVISAFPRGERSLGALRNAAVDLADGDFVSQWDDDDLYHPSRLSAQMRALLRHKATACFLSDQMQLVTRTGDLYWCNWSKPRDRANWPQAIPNTLLCETKAMIRYPEEGPESRVSEDLYVMWKLSQKVTTLRLAGAGASYIYVTHGNNTWDEDHHLGIVRTCGLDGAELKQRRPVLAAALRSYRFQEDIVVRGYEGDAVMTLKSDGTVIDHDTPG
jgi:glycosyltransferase involved in cell wall biosynthesis